MGELQKALDHFNQVLTLYQNAKNTRAEVSALFNIGVMYSQLGDTQRALETYGRALAIMRELKYPFGESYALYNIATVHNSLNEPQKALEELNEALGLSRQIGDRSQETRVLNELGRTMKLMGQTQKALDFFNQITLPITTPGLVAAATLVFISVMKELPATLLLRPNGFETLAIRIWSATSEAFYTRASAASLALLAVSIVPLLVMTRRDLNT